MSRVYIFDTTLRDGEQSPGCSMTTPEKLEMATALVDLGVDILEAGFPIASEGDFEAVDAVSRQFPMGPSRSARAIMHSGREACGGGAAACEAAAHSYISCNQRHSFEAQAAKITAASSG